MTAAPKVPDKITYIEPVIPKPMIEPEVKLTQPVKQKSYIDPQRYVEPEIITENSATESAQEDTTSQ